MVDVCDSTAGDDAMSKARPVLDRIACPGCGAVIPVSDMIYHQVADQAEQDLKAKAARQERALADKNSSCRLGSRRSTNGFRTK